MITFLKKIASSVSDFLIFISRNPNFYKRSSPKEKPDWRSSQLVRIKTRDFFIKEGKYSFRYRLPKSLVV